MPILYLSWELWNYQCRVVSLLLIYCISMRNRKYLNLGFKLKGWYCLNFHIRSGYVWEVLASITNGELPWMASCLYIIYLKEFRLPMYCCFVISWYYLYCLSMRNQKCLNLGFKILKDDICLHISNPKWIHLRGASIHSPSRCRFP